MEQYTFRGFYADWIMYDDMRDGWIYGFLGKCMDDNKYYIQSIEYGDNFGEGFLVDEKSIGQCTGRKDKNGVKIYKGDIIQAYNGFNMIIGIVKFGEYEQDGSGGEYDSITCTGLYVERVKTIPTKEEIEYDLLDLLYEPSYEKTTSLQSYEHIEVIGNIYDNPELLENIE